ncbi:MAG: LemA family protein [Bacilli bacterium]|nr:LemA family protein [Bacilli bacterium]
MIKILIGVAIVILLFIIIFVIYGNRFNFAIIKINEAESNLDILLNRKLDLLERTVPIIKKELKLEEFMAELNGINEANLNHFQLNEILKTEYDELFKTLDENEKLFKSESLNRILRDLNDNEEAIIGSIKFYNDNVVIFNQLVSSFPSKIVALFKRYKRKDFYNDENKEMYEILAD